MAGVWILREGPLAGIYFESKEEFEILRARVNNHQTTALTNPLLKLNLPIKVANKVYIEFFKAMETGKPPKGFVNATIALQDLMNFIQEEKKKQKENSNES
jgi:hypothetical protein